MHPSLARDANRAAARRTSSLPPLDPARDGARSTGSRSGKQESPAYGAASGVWGDSLALLRNLKERGGTSLAQIDT